MGGLRNRSPNIPKYGFSGFIFLFATNIPEAWYFLGGPPPIIFQLVFIIFFGLYIVARSASGFPVVSAESASVIRPLALWLYLWIASSIIGSLISDANDVAVQITIDRTKMAIILILIVLVIFNFRSFSAVTYAMAVGAVFSSFVNIYDFFIPTFTGVPGRASGLFLNPNISGFMITMSGLAGLLAVKKPIRWIYFLFVAVAVALTFSRAAWLLLSFSTVFLFWMGEFGFKRQRLVLSLALLLFVAWLGNALMSGALVDYIELTPLSSYLDLNTLSRLNFLTYKDDFSTNERRTVAEGALQLFFERGSFLFGNGLGFTQFWNFRVSTHNMYLLYLVEGGFLGLSLYVSLIGMLLFRSIGVTRILATNVFVWSFFSHNLLDSPARVLLIAIVLTSTLKLSGVARR